MYSQYVKHLVIAGTAYYNELVKLIDYLNSVERFYSQTTLNNRFINGHRKTYIRHTIDDLDSGQLKITEIPPLTVTKRPGSNKRVS